MVVTLRTIVSSAWLHLKIVSIKQVLSNQIIVNGCVGNKDYLLTEYIVIFWSAFYSWHDNLYTYAM